MKISEALEIAVRQHRAGHLSLAGEIYQRILAAEPLHAEALHLLGVALHQAGDHGTAVRYLERAIEVRGTDAVFHNSLGEVYAALGRTAEAVACYRRAMELRPGYAEALYNLGIALKRQGKPDEAADCYRRALELEPNFEAAHNNLGIVLHDLGKLDEAIACYRRALAANPRYADAYNNLGAALKDQGSLDEAVACYQQALQREPECAATHYNLGLAFEHQGRLEEAASCYRRALELEPGYAEAHNNLGIVLKDQGRPEEAVACHRRALALKPECAEAHNSLGNALRDLALPEEAVACYRRALELKPDYVAAHDNLLYMLHYCPGYDARTICEEHRRWNQTHASRLAPSPGRHGNDRAPDRRLRLGYVSADFRQQHPLCLIGDPLFSSHDHREFEIFCYSDVNRPDAWTARVQSSSDAWRDIHNLADEQVADLIRRDRVDILVDLGMHMAQNRLLVFCRKPAPVQVTWFAYPSTTGVSAIDYRLTDPYLDPFGQNDEYYTERSVRLPDCFWCYHPGATEPVPNLLPALERGRVTFGCLNNFCKVNELVLQLWATVLRRVPGSALVLLAPAGASRRKVLDLFAREAVAADRVEFADPLPRVAYLARYHGIDVALDTFPYNGHTTSLDALWMGVPVVSLAGQTAVGRAGLSILSNVGLPELVARDVENYVRIAADLASDLPRLAELRAALRQRMLHSPLMDGPRFARNIEAAYRQFWRRWCAADTANARRP